MRRVKHCGSEIDWNIEGSHWMDHFLAGLTDASPAEVVPVEGQYALCGIYAGVVEVEAQILTVKCNAQLPAFRFVIIQVGSSVSSFYYH